MLFNAIQENILYVKIFGTMKLILDSSTKRACIIVVNNGVPVFSKYIEENISSNLLTTINNFNLTDFSHVVVGIGPGSYTGIRIGMTIAQTISFAKKIPLFGINSLHIYVPPNDGTFITLLGSNMGEVLLVKGEKSGDTITFSPYEKLSINVALLIG